LPGIAVAKALREQGNEKIRWIGDPQRIEATLVPAAGIPLLPLGLSRPRLASPRWILSAIRQAWHCLAELRQRPPGVVVALGGYASLLPGLLAPLLRRPLVVLEQNARPGRTNRLLARFAQAVVTQFPEARAGLPARRIRQLGNPVRAIAPARRGGDRMVRVLVMGGSLSAKSLNDTMLGVVNELAAMKDVHIVHLAGEDDKARVAGIYSSAGVDAEVHGFFHDMPALYNRIDVVIGRAGATTVAELCAAGIGALYIPLPWAADDHQTANASAVARVGGASVLPQGPNTGAQTVDWLRRLASDRALIERMGISALSLARPDAARDVAALVKRVDATSGAKGRHETKRQSRSRMRRVISFIPGAQGSAA
jgi:UDP-N-acetylglucosamine--N-acetylmuramyl-(pentapeptide) pyrophosphoryl-undecaprenol N-acetylglucosamine transferase